MSLSTPLFAVLAVALACYFLLLKPTKSQQALPLLAGAFTVVAAGIWGEGQSAQGLLPAHAHQAVG